MRVLIASDTVHPQLTATQTAAALADGWRLGAPEAVVDVVPLAAGGPGTLELVAAHGASQTWVDPSEVLGTLEQHSARTIVDGSVDPQSVGEKWARLTSLATTSSSRALAPVVSAATNDAREIIITAGDVAARDAGLGLLAALGDAPATLLPHLDRGGLAAEGLGAEHEDELAETVARALRALRGTTVRVAATTDEPLFGLHGANANLSRATGVDAHAAQDLERALGNAFARLDRVRAAAVERAGGVGVGAQLALAGAAARRSGTAPGSGAGGGLAAMLEYLGARIEPAADIVAQAVGLGEAMNGADLVVTAVPVLDGSALAYSIPATVGRFAVARASPVVVLAREVCTSARELAPIGVAGAYQIAVARHGNLPPERTPAQLLDDARSRARRLAQTWRL